MKLIQLLEKCGLASQNINTHGYSLGVRKSKVDDMCFLIFHLLGMAVFPQPLKLLNKSFH